MGKSLKAKLILLVVSIQSLFFVGWYVYEADGFDEPVAQIMVKPIPYDPRDWLSGQYLRMNYDFSRPSVYGKGALWVVLKEKDGFYEMASSYKEKPNKFDNGDVVIRGYRKDWRRVNYGIERYFVPEGTLEPKPEDTTVLLNVYENGKVRINQVYVKGEIYP